MFVCGKDVLSDCLAILLALALLWMHNDHSMHLVATCLAHHSDNDKMAVIYPNPCVGANRTQVVPRTTPIPKSERDRERDYV